jgi:hypothetical protein
MHQSDGHSQPKSQPVSQPAMDSVTANELAEVIERSPRRAGSERTKPGGLGKAMETRLDELTHLARWERSANSKRGQLNMPALLWNFDSTLAFPEQLAD